MPSDSHPHLPVTGLSVDANLFFNASNGEDASLNAAGYSFVFHEAAPFPTADDPSTWHGGPVLGLPPIHNHHSYIGGSEGSLTGVAALERASVRGPPVAWGDAKAYSWLVS